MTNILYRTLTADSVATGASGNNFLGEDQSLATVLGVNRICINRCINKSRLSYSSCHIISGCAILLNFQMHKNVFEALGTARYRNVHQIPSYWDTVEKERRGEEKTKEKE